MLKVPEGHSKYPKCDPLAERATVVNLIAEETYF